MSHNNDEEEWLHVSIDASTLHRCLILGSTICILLAGYAAHRKEVLPMNNYGNKTNWLAKPRSSITNSSLYLGKATAGSHLSHKTQRKKLVRYYFGTSSSNYCHQKTLPQGWLPSLPRVLEINITAQVLLRITVLLGLNPKSICTLQPLLELLSSAMLVIMASLQQQQDKTVRFLMPYNFPIFSALFIVNGALCVTLDRFDLKKQKAVPQGWLPSLSRVLEMKIAPQALLRLAVLLGVNIKFILCLIRCTTILELLEGGKLVRLLCRVQPILELFSSAVLMTMTSMHQQQDRSVKWIMRYNFPLFSALYLLNGTLCVALDIIDPRKTFSSTFFNLKVSCLIAYSVCAPTVHETLLEYYAEKPCHTYVPYRSAVAEYACILSLLVFSMSQFDLNGLSGLRITVPSLPDDHITTCSADYAPAVSSQYKNGVAPEDSVTPIIL
ncbi:unnamed protein product [Cylicocyclus nassatus]|uniref:Uncharacterized protein n=1 Tax=Cylicocyclus nassatus TaxID=53992 RepID=A0AA36H2E3_CYLNA|nr:unnamed protein product [Cylicocyclus nassatus]